MLIKNEQVFSLGRWDRTQRTILSYATGVSKR